MLRSRARVHGPIPEPSSEASSSGTAAPTGSRSNASSRSRCSGSKKIFTSIKGSQNFGEIKGIEANPEALNASVLVSFSKAEEAQICVQKMNGRCFDGKQLRATLHLA